MAPRVDWRRLCGFLVLSCLPLLFAGCQRTSDVPHTVTTPSVPAGPSSAEVGREITFSTGGASCTRGHSVQYRFDWGDGTFSSWSYSSTASKTFSNPGVYSVRAQARCAEDPAVVSGWSTAATVTVTPGSSSGKYLQILDWQLLPYDNMFMPWVIKGHAKNISGRTLRYASVRGHFYDAAGVLLCSWLDNITDLPAGAVWEFSIYFFCDSDKAGRVARATVQEGTCF